MHKLRERFHQAEDHRKKLEIQREWLFEKKKMDIYEFMQEEKRSHFYAALRMLSRPVHPISK